MRLTASSLRPAPALSQRLTVLSFSPKRRANHVGDRAVSIPSVYVVDDAPFAAPISAKGEIHFQIVSAPENVIYPDAGLTALMQPTGVGDEIDLVQLYEQKF